MEFDFATLAERISGRASWMTSYGIRIDPQCDGKIALEWTVKPSSTAGMLQVAALEIEANLSRNRA
jgi:hypothetical protein